MENKIKQIFEEIDYAIMESISKKPIPIEQSNFLKKYKEIKKKWTSIK